MHGYERRYEGKYVVKGQDRGRYRNQPGKNFLTNEIPGGQPIPTGATPCKAIQYASIHGKHSRKADGMTRETGSLCLIDFHGVLT